MTFHNFQVSIETEQKLRGIFLLHYSIKLHFYSFAGFHIFHIRISIHTSTMIRTCKLNPLGQFALTVLWAKSKLKKYCNLIHFTLQSYFISLLFRANYFNSALLHSTFLYATLLCYAMLCSNVF